MKNLLDDKNNIIDTYMHIYTDLYINTNGLSYINMNTK
jgi:hypothetical protein